jgi:adenylate cyclase
MSMMMVDIRNSVALSAEITPTAYARLVAAMREDVLTILEETDGFVLEFQGDCVFGVWPPGFVGPSHAAKAIEAAGLATQIFSRRDSSSYVGIGVHTGPIYVGTLSAPGGRFFGIGAFGLNVNILARLTHAAAAGEALVSTATFETAGVPLPADRVRQESLKGIDVPVSAVSLRRPELAAP